MSGAEAKIQRLTDPKWQVSAPGDEIVFIRNLHRLLGEGAYLVVEGTIAEDVKRFLKSCQPPTCPKIELDTIWPRPEVFHLPVSSANLEALADLMSRHALPEVCDHLKAYKGNHEIMAWYDAGWNDPCYVSEEVGEDRLAEFCRIVGCRYEVVNRQDKAKG